MTKKRLDVLMAERELTESRNKAQRLIRAGEVRVDGQLIDQPSTQVSDGADVSLQTKPPFVSRGGRKLDAALVRFDIDVRDMVTADVGASTGGFTDCLLQHGARRVYAIDAGYGQLHWDLRNDPRVVVMERTNARYLDSLPESVDLVTVDVSFISLALILPRAVGWLKQDASVVALIKPQFEAGPENVERGGVVRDSAVHRAVLNNVLDSAAEVGLGLHDLMPSPLSGPAGNIEFLAWWKLGVNAVEAQSALALTLAALERRCP
ncbi:MAG: TlyA family RNA methyltransferase [Anaerolineae bacterium]|jgi:23S rRNA (cytidine1920-2'-O)/16S rRNA (cytidine1409-2'-O)-methyltransferase